MSLRRALCFVILASALPTAFVLAQDSGTPPDRPPKPDNARFGDPTSVGQNLRGYIYGVVKKVGKDELILDKTPFGDAQPFKLEAKTKYVRDGKSSKLAEFKPGDQVFVAMKKDKKNGDLIAKRVVGGLDNPQQP